MCKCVVYMHKFPFAIMPKGINYWILLLPIERYLGKILTIQSIVWGDLHALDFGNWNGNRDIDQIKISFAHIYAFATFKIFVQKFLDFQNEIKITSNLCNV